MENYDNLIEAIAGLKTQGYEIDFNLKPDCIQPLSQELKIFHEDFEIDKSFIFEGDDSSPDDTSIIYAISSAKYNLKGTLINSYGIYSDDTTDAMLSKLNSRRFK